jgi:Xaa-Pro aminopeptidase
MVRLRFVAALAPLAAALTLALADPPKAGEDPHGPRRERLGRQVDESLALIPAAKAAKDFRQDNDFWYLTGLDWADAVLAVSGEGSWIFHGEARGKLEPVAFFDPKPAGFTGILPLSQLAAGAGRYEEAGLMVPVAAEEYYSAPNRPGNPGSLDQPFARAKERAAFVKKMRRRHEDAEMSSLDAVLGRLRQVKDAGEIEELRRAARVTGEALIEAIARTKPGMKERDFQRILEQGYLDRGAEWLAFSTIAAAGKNAVTVHYVANTDEIRDGDMVLCDTGAETGHYASDVSRTFPANGAFSKRQREVYEAVLDAQESAIALVKPGATLMSIDFKAREMLRKHGFKQIMPHQTSHWIGLAVHDPGDWNVKLKPGMVLTVEPGIYLAEEGIGCRIEDVVLVTENGHEVLTAWIPKKPEEMEKLAGSKAK